jgi:hypothetical protein
VRQFVDSFTLESDEAKKSRRRRQRAASVFVNDPVHYSRLNRFNHKLDGPLASGHNGRPVFADEKDSAEEDERNMIKPNKDSTVHGWCCIEPVYPVLQIRV